MAKRQYSLEERAEILWVYITNPDYTGFWVRDAYGSGAKQDLPKWKRDKNLVSYIAKQIEAEHEDVEALIKEKEDSIKRKSQRFGIRSYSYPRK